MIIDAFHNRSFSVKFFHFNGRDYCLDLCKPKLFYVTSQARQALEQIIQNNSSDFEYDERYNSEIANQLNQLKRQGFFSGVPLEVTKDDRSINKISLAISSACNFRCRYCYFDDAFCGTSNDLMERDVAVRAIDFLCEWSTNQVPEIDFFGGEPLLNFGLIKTIIEYCQTKNRRFSYSITTNGSLVTTDIATFFKQHNFSVIVSLDGPEAVHDNARCFADGRGTFNMVSQGLDLLKMALPPEKLTVNAVVTKNYPQADKISGFFHDAGISRIAVSTVTAPEIPDLDMDEDSMNEFIESENRVFSAILNEEQNYPKYLPITQFMRYFNIGNPRPYRCGVGRDNLAISPDGTIYACHRFMGRHDFALGTLFSGIDEDRRSHYYNLHETFDKTCAGCWARYICGGPCIYDSFAYFGDIHKTVPLKCNRIRNLIELSAKLYGELATNNKAKLARLIS